MSQIEKAQRAAETVELYSITAIREAFERHASEDSWQVKAFYEDGLVAALRGEYDDFPGVSG